MATHTNTENETIEIDRITAGQFAGEYILIIWDDAKPKGSGIPAPLLLDAGTRNSLLTRLTELQGKDSWVTPWGS